MHRAWLAWHIGLLAQTEGKNFPKSPADLLAPVKENAAPDWRAMDKAAKAWTVNQGGAVVLQG